RLLRELAPGGRAPGAAGLHGRLRPGPPARARPPLPGLGVAAALPAFPPAGRPRPGDPFPHPRAAPVSTASAEPTGGAGAADGNAAPALARGAAGRGGAPERELLLLPVQRLRAGLRQGGAAR